MSTVPAKVTPAMKQYYEMKAEHADSILFFRMGDFYEMFNDDAKIVSKELGLTLTTRNKNSDNPVPLAGIPYHAAEKYLAELTRKGYKVTIAEQTSDPKLPGIVQREVRQVVTPGTTLQTEVLDAKGYNYLVALAGAFPICGVSFLDVSTGIWQLTECASYEAAIEEILLKAPKEVLIDSDFFNKQECIDTLKKHRIFVQEYAAAENNASFLLQHFEVPTLSILDLENKPAAIAAAVLSLTYVYNTQKTKPEYIHTPKIYSREGKMILDMSAVRNLELFSTLRDNEKKGSLLYLLDQTNTGGGGRLLRSWMLSPELKQETLEERLDAVEFLYKDSELRKTIRSALSHTSDIERLLARLSLGRGNARDLLALAGSLEAAAELHAICQKEQSLPVLIGSMQNLFADQTVHDVTGLIQAAISPEAGMEIMSGSIIKEGYDAEVDELRTLKQKAKEWMMEYQQKEQENTGISQLKVKFTSVFGYFLEIPKSQEGKVPMHYVRKQTLVGAERYITEELKVFEEKVLTSEEKSASREYELFIQIKDQALTHIPLLQQVALQISTLDVISTFAEVAYLEHYVRPAFTTQRTLEVQEGRHPVVASLLKEQQEAYVPNSLTFIEEKEEFLLITGPNMAGKSTYLRQAALIAYLAQIGCFVPAASAVLPLYDRIFTRVGASDNMSKGESTFMVEMQEASFILRNATANSLIILDEIGRGTSTYDGLSIAWAIVSYIHDSIGAHTLFATHYHELIDVAEKLSKAKNYSVAISENESGVIFLHQIIEGGASESYGIEVAKLAGLPKEVLTEAKKHLKALESTQTDAAQATTPTQDSLFTIVEQHSNPDQEKIIEELRTIDVNQCTPIQTMELLSKIVEKVQKL